MAVINSLYSCLAFRRGTVAPREPWWLRPAEEKLIALFNDMGLIDMVATFRLGVCV
jgi:hypothetical protein